MRHRRVLKRRYGRARGLSVFDQHQLDIARRTLRMPDAMVAIMGGGLTKAGARRVIRELTGREP